MRAVGENCGSNVNWNLKNKLKFKIKRNESICSAIIQFELTQLYIVPDKVDTLFITWWWEEKNKPNFKIIIFYLSVHMHIYEQK